MQHPLYSSYHLSIRANNDKKSGGRDSARTHKHRPECLELVCAQNTLNVVAYQIGLKVFVDIGVEDWGVTGGILL